MGKNQKDINQTTFESTSKHSKNSDKDALSLMAKLDFIAYIQGLKSDYKSNLAENKKLKKQISNISKRSAKKEVTLDNIGISVIAGAVLGPLAAAALLQNGVFEPNYSYDNMSDSLAIASYGMAFGSGFCVANTLGNCAKPITRIIAKHRIAKKQRQIDQNLRKNAVISYIQERLQNQPNPSNLDTSTSKQLDDQLEIEEMQN